ncbi:hypothetical protein ACWGR4_02125 [Embleya sp. NPDC055664]
MISNVVVTSEFPRTGGGAGAGRANGRRTAIGCSGGGATTGGVVGGGVVGGGGGVVRTGGGVVLGTTSAIGVARSTGGAGVLRTGVGFVGGGVGLGVVGLGVVGVGLGPAVGRQDPLRNNRKSTVSPIPPVGGPVAGVTSTRTLAPGDPPIETHTSTCAPGV